MPFDTENAVKWDSNYIHGYTSEKRDTNVTDLKDLVEVQCKDVARFAANDSLKFYDRGVRWDFEQLKLKGQQWKSAYLPVWLYSYQQKKGNDSILHYVAVNARSKETMGSVPIHMPKLIAISAIVEVLGIISAFFISNWSDKDWPWMFVLAGIIYYAVMYARYRNQGARHHHETETKTNVSNMTKVDNFVKSKKRLRNATMDGANNKLIHGQSSKKALVKHLTERAQEDYKEKIEKQEEKNLKGE